MTSIFAKKLRLRPTVLALFVLLTVPVFFTIIAVTYVSNDTIARANADQLVERFRIDAVENIQNVFDPIKSLGRSSPNRTRRRTTIRARGFGTGLPRGKTRWSSPTLMFSRPSG